MAKKPESVTQCPRCGSIYATVIKRDVWLPSKKITLEMRCTGVFGVGCSQEFVVTIDVSRITVKK